MSAKSIARFNQAAVELQGTEFRRRTPNDRQYNPAPSDYAHLFDAVVPLLAAFRAMTPEQRAAVGSNLTPESLVTLRYFAQNTSVLAVRRSSPELIEEGLTALAVLAQTDDPRDLCFSLAKLHHSALKLGLDTQTLFSKVAGLVSSTYFEEAMRTFPLRPPEIRELSAFYLHEVLTEHGYDFTQDSFDSFRPGHRASSFPSD